MFNILLRSGSFVFLIILGAMLKHFHFFSPKDYAIPTKIVLNITLPAAVITSFASYRPDPSLLILTGLGLGINALLLILGFALSKHKDAGSRPVWINSIPGYNIGSFALPFIQSFLSPASVVACCLFDTGNALMCTGGTYAISSGILGGGENMSLKAIGKKLLSSAPFMTYLIMLIVSMIGIRVPEAVVTFLNPLAVANPFLSMMMVGMMFDTKMEKETMKDVWGMLVIRILVSIAACAGFYFLLPFSLEIRKALALAVFAPVSISSTIFAEKMGGDPAEAACINSLYIPVSVTCIVILLTIFGTL